MKLGGKSSRKDKWGIWGEGMWCGCDQNTFNPYVKFPNKKTNKQKKIKAYDKVWKRQDKEIKNRFLTIK